MAAAYAALVSLSNLIEQVQLHHTRKPIFPRELCILVESLQEKVLFLQNLLECHLYGDGSDAEDLDRQIADAVYSAEDIIESHVVDSCDSETRYETQIKSIFSGVGQERFSFFSEGLYVEIARMEYFIKKKLIEINEKSKPEGDRQLQTLAPHASSSSLRPTLLGENNTTVGFDDNFHEIVDKLTRQQYHLQQIAITGMGGIGKTTLAKTIYESKSIAEYFDVRGWITISQEYNVKDMLLGLLCNFTRDDSNKRDLQSANYHQVGEKVRKHLWMRRYLIVMDDIWSIEAWDKLKLFFPDNENGSRIVLTTRLATVANNFGPSSPYKMNLLDENHSWRLLCTKVFGEEICPRELEKIGKTIAENCKGLPLSISVIGGLLAKSELTREYWESIAGEISATVNAEDDERCAKILSLSFRNLPIHLKPCFLYMGIFPEDKTISVSNIIRLWIAEGFLKPSNAKDVEEVAREYLQELVDRNLLFVGKLGLSRSTMKNFKIHDLLRDFCLREAKKESFFSATDMPKPHFSHDIVSPRRVAIHPSDPYPFQPGPFLRSYTYDDVGFLKLPSHNFRLLRVPNVWFKLVSPKVEFKLFNLRLVHLYITRHDGYPIYRFPSSISLLWNLQTLIVSHGQEKVIAPYEIWNMPQLRQVKFDPHVILPNPQCGQMDGKDETILHNLQTLKKIVNFSCNEQVTRKIPNIKKLRILYTDKEKERFSHYQLNNLSRLHTLQSLSCHFLQNWPSRKDLLKNLSFPRSLKKLYLDECSLEWKDAAKKLGPLPNLEVLVLKSSFVGEKWYPIEGQFVSLRVLSIKGCDMVHWGANSAHFPRLEYLHLIKLRKLKKIPSEIGEIPTLKAIGLLDCSYYVVTSAKKIIKEQRSFGNVSLGLWVDYDEYDYKEGEGEDEEDEEEEDASEYDDVTDEDRDENREEKGKTNKKKIIGVFLPILIVAALFTMRRRN